MKKKDQELKKVKQEVDRLKRLNKKVTGIFSIAWANITGKPSFFSGSYNDLSNKPTIPAAQNQSDWNQANTSAVDYIKNKPTPPKRSEVFSATTNASGIASFSFSAFTTPIPGAPVIVNATVNQGCRLTAITSTSATVHAWQRNSVTLLGVDVLLSASVNLPSVTVHLRVSEA